MTVYNWLKVKVLYYSSIKSAFQRFLQLGDVSFRLKYDRLKQPQTETAVMAGNGTF